MNPWEEISLSDYENHMRLDSVRQLQTLNIMMKNQFTAYPVSTAMILGIAGGNGLEHIDKAKYNKIYGIDINEEYLNAAKERYTELNGILDCRRIDVIKDYECLPKAELVIADLFIEYVGYDVFKNAVMITEAKFVSCIIQINIDEKEWVSDSPYLHAFDDLDTVHNQMDEDTLTKAMNSIGYRLIKNDEHLLPNGKKLLMLDYTH